MKWLTKVKYLASLSICFGLYETVSAQLPSNIKFTKTLGTNVAEGRFLEPTWMGEMPGNPGVFVVLEQGSVSGSTRDSARVRIVEKNSDGSWTKSTLFSIGNIWQRTNESGLLSFAFHPQFTTNRRYFILYNTYVNGDCFTQLVERKVDATLKKDSGDPPKTLIQFQKSNSNHNGGNIVFGPLGHLYASFGEDAKHTPAQDLTSLLGKLIRIDVNTVTAGQNYNIPSDNPFASSTTAGIRKEIWAYGLRNPWRFSFDSNNNNLWLADVGENSREEIDLIRKGDNLGWPCYEADTWISGAVSCAGAKLPVRTLSRSISYDIIGGLIYRTNPASPIYGHYVFADHTLKSVYVMSLNDTVATAVTKIGPSDIALPDISMLSHLGTDAAGRIYAVGHELGEIYLLDDPTLLPNAGPPPPPPPAPNAPTSATATPGNSQVTLIWPSVSGATSYQVYWAQGSTASKSSTKISNATSPTLVSSLTAGVQYAFVVTASNGAGESAESPVALAIPSAPTPPPATPGTITATPGIGQMTLAWANAAGAASYQVYWKAGTTVTKATGTKTDHASSGMVITNLSPGTQYAFILIASNAAGESGESPITLATPSASPLVFTTTALPASRARLSFSTTLAASGGIAPYTFALTSGTLPTGLTLTNATLAGTPTQAGTFNLIFEVTDAANVKTPRSLVLKVAPNRAPKLTSVATAKASEASNFTYTAIANDSDGNALTYSFPVLPNWLKANGAKAGGIPSASDADTTLWVFVTDGELKDSLAVILTITHTNKAPSLDSVIAAPTTLAEGDSIGLRVVASDPEKATLTYLWSLDDNTPISGTAQRKIGFDYSSAGAHTWTLRVEDPEGASVEHDFKFTITNTQLPPICLHAPGNVAANEEFVWGWAQKRDPDLDSATLLFQFEAYGDSALTQTVLKKDNIAVTALSPDLRNQLPNNKPLWIRVAAYDGKSYSTGVGLVRAYTWVMATSTQDWAKRKAARNAYLLIAKPQRTPSDTKQIDASGRTTPRL